MLVSIMGDSLELYLILVVVLITAILVLLWYKKNYDAIRIKLVGKQGERIARKIIKRGLNKDDVLLSNITINYEDRMCECDDIIINEYGVFIVEVKNYSGKLYGGVNDKEWIKVSFGKGGKPLKKVVKNPFKQVNRNVDILSKYLSNIGLGTLVKGYVIVLNNNQVVGNNVIKSGQDIDREMHNSGYMKENNHISKDKKRKIVNALLG